MKKSMKMLVVAALTAAVAFAAPQNAEAKQKFCVENVGPYGDTATIDLPSTKARWEVEVLNSKGKSVDKRAPWKGMSFATFLNLKKNETYYVRYRKVDDMGNALSKWSKKKIAFTSVDTEALVRKIKLKGEDKFTFKMPKVKGVKKYNILISTKEKSGFKKTATVKPGKSVVIKKCKGKSLKEGTYYYLRLKPVLKKKAKSVYINALRSVRITRGFF